MAYLAMARKWRPRNFEEMVGQDHIAQTIRNAIEGKRISHAYLFTGTRGVGKTTSARILAKALNCLKGPTPTPCDACENCKSVNTGNSMDVLEIDGASNNGVDNIRELREQVKYAPMHGTYKIYIVDEVHMLSKPAFNALLKTLEEPPPHVVFIFATTEAGKVPHTILSRVQRFDFKRISETHIRERLEFICAQEAIKPEREALEAIARKADGSMRDALSLFDQVYAYSGADLSMEAARKVLGLPRESMFDSLLRALVKHDQKECFVILQDSHREGIETSELLVAFGEYLRNLLFARQGVTPAVLGLGEQRFNELLGIAPELRDGDIIRFAKLISDLLAALKTAANPRLAVELGFARMASLDRVVTLSQVLGQEIPPATSPGSHGAAPATAAYAAASRPGPEAGSQDPDGVKKKNPVELRAEPVARPAPAIQPSSIVHPSRVTGFGESPSLGDPGPTEPLSPAVVEAIAQAAAAPDSESAPIEERMPLADAHTETPSGKSASAAIAEPPPVLPATIYVEPSSTVSEGVAMRAAAASSPPTAGPSPESSSPSFESNTHTAVLTRSPSAEDATEADADEYPEDDTYSMGDPEEMEDPEARKFPAQAKVNTGATPEPDSRVPKQDHAAALPELWPRLVAEFMAERPLLGSHLRQSRLSWDEVTPGLHLVFGEKAAFFLVGDDPESKKSIQAFLASKVKGRFDVPLHVSLDPEVAAGAEAAEAMHVPTGGVEDDMRREPILRIIQDMFDGRLIN